MNALSWLPNLSHSSIAIVFDIGSASVGVAIAKYKNGEPIEVLFTHRSVISYGEDKSAKSLSTYLNTAIKKAGKKALKAMSDLDVGSDYVVQAIVHAPWVDSVAEKAEAILEKDTRINREILRQFRAHHLPETKMENRIQFDSHVTQIELNGYNTLDPYDKDAKKIAMTILKSSMSDVVHKAIYSAFSSILPNHEVHIDAFLFVTTQLPELFDESDTYTLIDIGEENTSLSIVRDKTIAGSAWADFGTEHLVRAVTAKDPDGRQRARSELGMFMENTCTPAQCRKIETALQGTVRDWTRAFGDACTKLSRIHRVPTKTFVSVDALLWPWFKKEVQKIDFGQFTVTGRPLEAELLSAEKSQRPLSFAKSVKKDSMLSLAILFVDK